MLFQEIESLVDYVITIRASYLEIYNEMITDLLA